MLIMGIALNFGVILGVFETSIPNGCYGGQCRMLSFFIIISFWEGELPGILIFVAIFGMMSSTNVFSFCLSLNLFLFLRRRKMKDIGTPILRGFPL